MDGSRTRAPNCRSYDASGNLLCVTLPAVEGLPRGRTGGITPMFGIGGGTGTCDSGTATNFAYDGLGELTSITDPLGNVMTLSYYSSGLLRTF